MDERQRHLDITRRWFTEGWLTNVSLADEFFSPDLITNGVRVGIDGPKKRILKRRNGFPDLITDNQLLHADGDIVAIHLLWRGTHTGPYGGAEPSGKPVEISDIAIWRFENGRVAEIRTVQDQFGLLAQIGYLPDTLYAV
ncbi:ester cyclase [Nocardia sp. NPDC101769]|uniref:ester cyclase n=1 Tax=Nocardia sp. NPDC101769 TaxID=3364333 RepID=UPI00382388DA